MAVTLANRAAAIRQELVNKSLHQGNKAEEPTLLIKKSEEVLATSGKFQPTQAPINAAQSATGEECVKILSQSIKTMWSIEDQKLIDWFLQLNQKQLPQPPFKLSPGVTTCGDIFYESCKRQIAEGPNTIRARNRVLQEDLFKLKALVDRKQTFM